MGREYQTGNFGQFQPNLGPHGPVTTPTSGGGGILIFSGNPNTLGATALPSSVALDATGSGFYLTTNGTTWVSIGSAGGCGGLSGVGSPQNVVTANPGTTFTQIDTGSFWTKQSGTGNSGWLLLIQ
jgi:hypothetical protein